MSALTPTRRLLLSVPCNQDSFSSALHTDGYSPLIYTSNSWGRTERSEFISLLLAATAHPLQSFQMKLRQTQSQFVTVFIPAFHSCSYFPISWHIFTVLALCVHLLCFSISIYIFSPSQPAVAGVTRPTQLIFQAVPSALLWLCGSVLMSPCQLLFFKQK